MPFSLITCRELLEEIGDIAARLKFIKHMNEGEFKSYLIYVQRQIKIIQDFATIHINMPVSIQQALPEDDSEDWYIHNLALQYDISVVTSDRHILSMKNKVPYTIIDAADFLAGL